MDVMVLAQTDQVMHIQIIIKQNQRRIFCSLIYQGVACYMIQEVTHDEIRRTMFSFCDEKAPGLNGYTTAFYKKAWDIVGNDVCLAVLDFFREGKLLIEMNHTLIALIPKVSTPFVTPSIFHKRVIR